MNIRNAEAHKILGRALMIIGRYDFAQTEFEQAVRWKPGSAEIHYNLGKVHSAQDNYPPAKRAFEEAVRLNSSYMEAFNGLGFVMEALGEDEAAVENYQKAAQLNEKRGGDFALPYVNLGSYYNRINRHELAIEYAQKALKFNPKSDSAYFQNMAKAHRYREEWSQAAEALETAISINPLSSQYYYLLGTAYRHLGKDGQSQQAFATFQKMEQESADFEESGARREGISLLQPGCSTQLLPIDPARLPAFPGRGMLTLWRKLVSTGTMMVESTSSEVHCMNEQEFQRRRM